MSANRQADRPKRTKLKGVAAPAPYPPMPHCVSEADWIRIGMFKIIAEASDEEIVRNYRSKQADPGRPPTLRIAAGRSA